MKSINYALFLLFLLIFLFSGCKSEDQAAQAESDSVRICYSSQSGGFHEHLAAREIRRYLYLRTDQLFEIDAVESVPSKGDLILIATKDSDLINDISFDTASQLKAQEYSIKTIDNNGRKIVVICGGDSMGALYGAYYFAEQLGIRFYLHGDVVADKKLDFRLPQIDEVGKPLFKLRGILPFHDFPEGPDWWSSDQYKAVFAQLPKMGMNFAGFHCYPQGEGPEPLVWTGEKEDVRDDGSVGFAYPSYWANTGLYGWGYDPMDTGDFAAGASTPSRRERRKINGGCAIGFRLRQACG